VKYPVLIKPNILLLPQTNIVITARQQGFYRRFKNRDRSLNQSDRRERGFNRSRFLNYKTRVVFKIFSNTNILSEILINSEIFRGASQYTKCGGCRGYYGNNIKENLEKQFYLRIKSILKSKLNGNNLIKAVNTYAVPLLTYSFGVIKWSKTNLQNINIKTRVLFTKFSKHHPKSAIERFNLPRENGGRGFFKSRNTAKKSNCFTKKLFPQ
jgi:hypothetical protein